MFLKRGSHKVISKDGFRGAKLNRFSEPRLLDRMNPLFWNTMDYCFMHNRLLLIVQYLKQKFNFTTYLIFIAYLQVGKLKKHLNDKGDALENFEKLWFWKKILISLLYKLFSITIWNWVGLITTTILLSIARYYRQNILFISRAAG